MNKKIPTDLKRIQRILQDDVVTTSYLATSKKEWPKKIKINTGRYARITPSFLKALAGYLNIPIKSLADLVGLDRQVLQSFERSYEPNRNFGMQVGYQCGFFWVTKILYLSGMIPYSLAKVGGIYDEVGEKNEKAFIREIRRLEKSIKKKRAKRVVRRKRKRNISTIQSKKIKRDTRSLGPKSTTNGGQNRSTPNFDL